MGRNNYIGGLSRRLQNLLGLSPIRKVDFDFLPASHFGSTSISPLRGLGGGRSICSTHAIPPPNPLKGENSSSSNSNFSAPKNNFPFQFFGVCSCLSNRNKFEQVNEKCQVQYAVPLGLDRECNIIMEGFYRYVVPLGLGSAIKKAHGNRKLISTTSYNNAITDKSQRDDIPVELFYNTTLTDKSQRDDILVEQPSQQYTYGRVPEGRHIELPKTKRHYSLNLFLNFISQCLLNLKNLINRSSTANLKRATTPKLLFAFVAIMGALLMTSCTSSTENPTTNPEIETSKIKTSSTAFWWGAVINDGYKMPFEKNYSANLIGNSHGNQTQPLLLSNEGDVIWSEEPFEFEYNGKSIVTKNDQGKIFREKGGENLQEAFQFASKKYFPPSGKMPDELLFSQPQYNTWIELMYDQNEEDILKYAADILKNKMPAGVLMIDDNWQENYGKWNFHQGRFPTPKKMMNQLHAQGFKVMLWVCPFVSADSDVYRKLRDEGLLIKNKKDQAAIVRWWNGASGLLDFSNPKAVEWFKAQLDFLQKEYDVDGFKFDAGDMKFYHQAVSHLPETTANGHAQLFAKIGLDYPLNEYRVNWKLGGQAIANRLRDKNHNWEDLEKLVPNMIMEGLMGYTFACPDMIGGGEFKSFLKLTSIDQELIVRSAQCHALMPMMQFSVAPWRILDAEHFEAVQASVALRKQFSEYIVSEAKKSAETGEPILRSLEYEFPKMGFEKVKNQFMLGEKLLVVPVIEKGAKNVNVLLPKGKWKGFDGEKYEGGGEIIVVVDLKTLPYFERI